MNGIQTICLVQQMHSVLKEIADSLADCRADANPFWKFGIADTIPLHRKALEGDSAKSFISNWMDT